MKYLFLLLLALIAGPAYTQAGGGPVTNPCNYPPPITPLIYNDLPGGFECMPKPGGTGTLLNVRTNLKGVTTYWYCPDNAAKPTKYRRQFGAATWARLATGDLKPDTPMADPSLSVVWCPWDAEMRAAAPVIQPDMMWVVSSPIAFNVSGTTLASTAGAVPLGTSCDCSKPTKIGNATYCTFVGAPRPTVMAACKVKL